MKPNIVLWDIETSHNILAKFDLREEYSNHNNILQERYMICAAWKTLGGKMKAVSVLDDPRRFKKSPHDDRHVIETLHSALAEADTLVAHNGDRFDWKWLKGRVLVHGLPPLPPIPTIDTLKVARRNFMLNSNRLDYLGKLLGFGGKTTTPPGLWIDVLKGEKKAIKTMLAYNKRDVELLENVFLKLEAYVPNHVSRQLLGDDGCPQCGSLRMTKQGVRRTKAGVYPRWKCENCGRWSQSTAAEKRKRPTLRMI